MVTERGIALNLVHVWAIIVLAGVVQELARSAIVIWVQHVTIFLDATAWNCLVGVVRHRLLTQVSNEASVICFIFNSASFVSRLRWLLSQSIATISRVVISTLVGLSLGWELCDHANLVVRGLTVDHGKVLLVILDRDRLVVTSLLLRRGPICLVGLLVIQAFIY